MQQAVITESGHLIFRQMPDLVEINKDETLLKMKCIGACAVAERVGEDVKNMKPGMTVTAMPQLVYGLCPPCKRGRYNVSQKYCLKNCQIRNSIPSGI